MTLLTRMKVGENRRPEKGILPSGRRTAPEPQDDPVAGKSCRKAWYHPAARKANRAPETPVNDRLRR